MNSNSKRKPNYKKWICPIDGVPVNSRGAAPYLRIKFGIKWDPRYMDNPELLCKPTKKIHFDKELYGRLVSIVNNMEFENDVMKDLVLEKMYSFVSEIRNNAKDHDKLDDILKIIEPITKCKFNFDD